MSLLEIKNLSVAFQTAGGMFTAVDRVSLTINPGEILSIVGESGSGKSVAMLALMGLLPWTATVTADVLKFDGKDLKTISNKNLRKIIGNEMAMIFQEPMTSLNPCFTVGFQLSEALKIHYGMGRKERKKRVIELLEQVPDITTVLVPLSGGGLAAGVATAIKETDASIRVIGVSMRRGAVMAASLSAGEPVDMPERPTLADSLQGGIGLDNRYTFGIVRQHVDDVVLIDEPEIWNGMKFALQHHRLVLEGGAAVGIGALLSGKVVPTGPTVVICTGSNVEPHHLAELAEELSAAARRENGRN